MKKKQQSEDGLETKYFKLPFIGKFSNIAQNRVNNLAKNFCKDIFTCAKCNSCYDGEIRRHFGTRVHEHLRDRSSHIFRHLAQSKECQEACSNECFQIIDQGTSFSIQLKEAMHIKWSNPF